jgi:alpha-beta hydrolase superfamily lysophospholipase
MVLCHGLAEHSGRYEAVGSRFAAAGISVTAYDQIGFGASGGRRAWLDAWSDVLDQIQSHIERARSTGLPVVVLGHSGGGLFALEYVLAERLHPDLLVLSAPGLGGGAAWQRFLAPILALLAPKLEVPNRLEGAQLSRDLAVGERYFADPLVHPRTTARYGNEMFKAMDRVGASLQKLSLPTLVIHGAADTIVPPGVSAVLGDLDVVERRLYPALRHELFNEPEGMAVVDDVIAWIDTHLS